MRKSKKIRIINGYLLFSYNYIILQFFHILENVFPKGVKYLEFNSNKIIN
jgi:hypothetical protein